MTAARPLKITALVPTIGVFQQLAFPSVYIRHIQKNYRRRVLSEGARGNVVSCTMLQTGRSRFQFLMRSLDFSIDLILPAALWPWGRLSL
jgi:hypothetical protein